MAAALVRSTSDGGPQEHPFCLRPASFGRNVRVLMPFARGTRSRRFTFCSTSGEGGGPKEFGAWPIEIFVNKRMGVRVWCLRYPPVPPAPPPTPSAGSVQQYACLYAGAYVSTPAHT